MRRVKDFVGDAEPDWVRTRFGAGPGEFREPVGVGADE